MKDKDKNIKLLLTKIEEIKAWGIKNKIPEDSTFWRILQ